MIFFRENSEDVYAGIEWESGSSEVAKVIDFWFNNQENDNKLLEHADD